MRPTYQRQHDLDNELSVMDNFADVMDTEVYFWHAHNKPYAPPENRFGFKKSPNFSCYDYMLTCDNVGSDFGSGPAVAVVEVKCRNYNHDDFDSYKISKRKIDNLINASLKHEIVSVLIVKWNDLSTAMMVYNPSISVYTNVPFHFPKNYFDYPITNEGYEIFENWYSDMNSYIQSGQITKTTWGRVDRKDPMDVETAYEIPMLLFRSV